MSDVLHDLDDPVPLAALSHDERATIIAHGESLRRRRRALVIGVPVVAAAVVAAVVVALVVVSGPDSKDGLTPITPSPPVLVLQGQEYPPAYSECDDAAGDSVGQPDVDFFSRDVSVLFHYGLVAGEMPSSGVVEFRIEATSADRKSSREFVQRIVDGTVVEQYMDDPNTGARLDVEPDAHPFGDSGDHGVGGAYFPGAAIGLGENWTWGASISVNGTVVDSCDPAHGRT